MEVGDAFRVKSIEWLFFNAVIPLIPVGIVWLVFWFLSHPGLPSRKIFSIIKDGQVFFYCTALTSVAIGDLGKAPSGFDTAPWVMALLFIIILSTAAFAAAAYNQSALNETKFGWCSVRMALASIIVVINFRAMAGLL
jgi:hypothetical protein